MTISAHTTSNLDKALALASNLGFHVFPCRPNAEQWANGRKLEAKSPRTKDGFYSATTDPDKIRDFWNAWPDSLVGVYTGASGLNVLDGDVKGGADYDITLFEHGLDTPATHNYETISGGRHYIYQAPEGIPMSGAAKYRGLPGVDRRAGASYIIWWSDDVPESRDAFTPAPEWLCDPVIESENSSAYNGDTETWLDSHRGEPSALFRHIITEDFPEPGEGEYEHDSALKLIIRIVSLGAEGESGATEVLSVLAEKYLDGFEEYESEWDGMVAWAIKNCGGTPMPELPLFMDTITKLGEDFPVDLLSSDNIEALVAECIRRGLTDAETFTIATNNREIDADTLWAVIELERDNAAEAPATEVDPPAPEVKPLPAPAKVEILTVAERRIARRHYADSWLGEYEDWARSQLNIPNDVYLRATAWVALSNLVGHLGRLSTGGRPKFPNLFLMLVGPTTSGKTEHDVLMAQAVKRAYPGNPAILGGNSSGAGLTDILLGRNGEAALLKVNEAGSFIRAIGDSSGKGSWQADLQDKITDYYDGHIEPKVRSGATADDLKWAEVCFNMYLYGTPERVISSLSKDMFEAGLLHRMQWYVGDRPELDEDRLGTEMIEMRKNVQAEETLDEWAERFRQARETLSFFKMGKNNIGDIMRFDSPETAAWFKKVDGHFKKNGLLGHPDREILLGSVMRHADAALRMAALVALSRGEQAITRDDLLVGLWQIEESMTNLLTVYSEMASSEHAKDLEMVQTQIASHKAGLETWEVLRWGADRNGWTQRETEGFLGELVSQKRIKREQVGKSDFKFTIK